MDNIRQKTVFNGVDNEVIPLLLELHCESKNPFILDCTYNKGSMWKNLNFNVLKMDKDKHYPINLVADFNFLPFDENAFDAIVFDPPHLPTSAASPNSSLIWKDRYGITDSGLGRDGDNISGMFFPFLLSAKRVLKKGGIILSKIADIVHNHRYQWHQVDFINAVRESGLTPCDMLIKCDPKAGNLKSNKWKNIKHLRKSHCYWIIVRNSKCCERKDTYLL